MGTGTPVTITVEAIVHAPVENVWNYWSEPEHIKQWNNASDDWHTPRAENDLMPGGKLVTRMEAKDGSFGFDFGGVYDEVCLHEFISYTLDDDMQQAGWQATLDNFKKYAESVTAE